MCSPSLKAIIEKSRAAEGVGSPGSYKNIIFKYMFWYKFYKEVDAVNIFILFWPALRIFLSFSGDFRIPAVDQIQRTSLSQKNHEGKNNAYHRVILTLSSVSQDNDQPRHNKFAILRPRSDENLIATDWVLVCTVSFLSIRGIWSRVQLLRLIYMYISAMFPN